MNEKSLGMLRHNLDLSLEVALSTAPGQQERDAYRKVALMLVDRIFAGTIESSELVRLILNPALTTMMSFRVKEGA